MNDVKRIDQFLGLVELALPRMDPSDRQEILQETRSHLLERFRTGRLEEALEALGSPEAYAAGFALAPAPGSSSNSIPVGSVSVRLAVAAIATVLAAPCLFALTMELINPFEFGLWVSPQDGFMVLGKLAQPEGQKVDLIGELMLPLSIILTLALGYCALKSVQSAIHQVR
ncbi:HAAS signaling domain-containing protein [Erythrobacter sp. HA6-11]